MKKYRILLIVALVLAVLGITYFCLPYYLRRALVYQNVNIDDYKIFDNRIIKAGTPQAWAVDADCNKKQISAEDMTQIEKYRTIAFLVIKDQKIKYEKYWDGYSEVSYSNSFSMAKSIVSLMIGIAIEEGKIDSVNQKVGDFLPQFKNGNNSQLTIKQLLTMSADLDWDESYSSATSITTKAYYGNNVSDLALARQVVKESGKLFNYQSGSTQLLALIVNKATGKNISEYCSEKIWQLVGAEHDAQWCLDHENGMEKAYCCFNSNARDFARFGQLLLNRGKWNDKQIVSESYLNQALTPASNLIDPADNSSVDFYGYQWWMLKYKGKQVYYMRGILGQYVFVIPELNTVIVRLGHERSSEKENKIPTDIPFWISVGLKIVE